MPDAPTIPNFAAMVREPGRHGYTLVAFDSQQQAHDWAAANNVELMVKPLLTPEQWQATDNRYDDDDHPRKDS